MQTFLPYSDFTKSAQCLDNKRLGKQRIEAWQIYQTLQKGKYKECSCGCNEVFNGHCVGCGSKAKITAWYNHPAVRMWKGYEFALLEYGKIICEEWLNRGYKDTLWIKFWQELGNTNFKIKYPSWLGNKKFHDAMKSNLLKKDKSHYSKFGWKVKENLPYVWGATLTQEGE